MEESSLTKTARFIKSEKYLIIIGSISVFTFLLFLFSRIAPSTPIGVSWKENIVPGKTSVQDLTEKLGQPTKTEVSGDKNIYFFDTESQYRPNKVEVEDEKVQVVKEEVIAKERGILQDYTSKYGKPEALVYGKQLEVAPGHFWGTKGILVFANIQTGLIFEIWYFSPTTLEKLMSEHPELRKTTPENI